LNRRALGGAGLRGSQADKRLRAAGGVALAWNYAVYFTVGQSVIGPSSSASYGSALSY